MRAKIIPNRNETFVKSHTVLIFSYALQIVTYWFSSSLLIVTHRRNGIELRKNEMNRKGERLVHQNQFLWCKKGKKWKEQNVNLINGYISYVSASHPPLPHPLAPLYCCAVSFLSIYSASIVNTTNVIEVRAHNITSAFSSNQQYRKNIK